MSKAKYDFTGKVVIVTGAAAGIGKAIAERFYQDGAQVVISDVNEEEGNALASILGSQASFITCDISSVEQVNRLISTTIDRFGKIDIMVNNAGINATSPSERLTIDDYPYETWKSIIDVDLNGTFYCCRAAAKAMVAQKGGAIINIASIAGIVSLRRQAGFVAAKAAIIRLTEAMACELGPIGIRVNAVSPGSVVTATTRRLFYSDKGSFSEMAGKVISFIPLGRPGEADEVSEAVVFLASDSASYINGQNLVVDGGWICGFNRDF